ncbi:MAG: nickel-dependent hydrogenase large subunit, partial [Denitrobacterium sp.]|nr:nickel-dependent hydrogenase large subunit [Denitrobacterium sp.]
MARTVIDPITRIEGHLRVEMEVEDGVITNAWSSGGCFRGMELVVRDRTPEDAAQIVQRICGVCPVSHAHAASIAGEKAYGITISNNARIIRNLVEGAQFLHSHILWFYNLCALDYVNPLNGLKANISDAIDLGKQLGLAMNTDLNQLASRLTTFADNKQLSIFSGNWFDSENGTGYKLPAEVDLILTGHYLEALTMQAKSSEIAGLLGGKMPHIMTSTVGGTMFVPTEEKLDDLWGLVNEVYNWVAATMIPDTLALVPYYQDALTWGKGCGRYGAWGVFNDPSFEMSKRYLPSGVLDENLNLSEVDEDKISEYVGHSWYEGDSDLNPREGETKPLFTEYDVNDRYTWVKAPTYDGKAMECDSLARILVAYKRGVPFIV